MRVLMLFPISLFFWIQDARGDVVVLTQSPKSLSLSIGDTVTIKCQTVLNIDDDINWYQQKPGQPPKLLIAEEHKRQSGVPDRFSSSGYDTDFTFTISNFEANDAGDYYCQQSDRLPLHTLCYTFGAGTKLEVKRREDSTPSVFIFPPSPEQLKTDSATAVCLVSTFYPSSLTVVWKVDGTPVTEGVQTSPPASDTDNTYKLSSTLTFPTSDFNTHELYSCEVTHKTLSSPLVKSFRRSECFG
ncbi:immunoglobulin kappa light chain-like [Podarcis raffonei]|uniref:immunoglobulin kappa light chain-like n=1 Tax=Podarcis raffonei TaxID=65483 RepID=UPI0023293706|nr:immunoglobulin kappa light chain-like [Podarcis raffonei]